MIQLIALAYVFIGFVFFFFTLAERTEEEVKLGLKFMIPVFLITVPMWLPMVIGTFFYERFR